MNVEISDDKVLILPAVLSIAEAEAFHGELCAVVQGGEINRIDASDVDRIDTSILQQLVALKVEMDRMHVDLIIERSSETFLGAAKLLGVTELLGLKDS